MAQKTMTEKDMFLQQFRQECATTAKILRAFPADQLDLKPADKLRSAKELAFVFVSEQAFADMALKGRMEMGQQQPAIPGTLEEIARAFEKASTETLNKVSAAGDEALNRTIQFPVGPHKMGDVRVMDVMWMTLSDQIHHRGQLSVYVRLAGAKLPSIYGPTADEPWM
ncbi:MAG TPA: DinB family protein [Candidatus Eisenbacteria bacterium]|nr:DinB family protein [Candidatus Eisenbacteria bacterium]